MYQLLFTGRRDILGAAETGSGKTLAFGLPMLTGIMQMKSKNIEGKVEDDPGIIHNDGMDMDVSGLFAHVHFFICRSNIK